MLAARFGLSDRGARSRRRRCCSSSKRCCARARDAGETTVLIVDEAQSLPRELLEEIRLLANIETNDEKLLSVIIAGQPELADRAERRVAAAVEAARRAALRAAAADAAGDGRLHRRPHPRRRRRRRAGVHARGGDADPRAVARHPAHDQRDRRQRAARRVRRRAAPGRQQHGPRGLPRLRSRARARRRAAAADAPAPPPPAAGASRRRCRAAACCGGPPASRRRRWRSRRTRPTQASDDALRELYERGAASRSAGRFRS